MVLEFLDRRLPPIGITFLDISPVAAGARRRRRSYAGYTPHRYRPIADFFPVEEEQEDEDASPTEAKEEEATISTRAPSSPPPGKSEGGTLTSSADGPWEEPGSRGEDAEDNVAYFSEGGMAHHLGWQQEPPTTYASEGGLMHALQEEEVFEKEAPPQLPQGLPLGSSFPERRELPLPCSQDTARLFYSHDMDELTGGRLSSTTVVWASEDTGVYFSESCASYDEPVVSPPGSSFIPQKDSWVPPLPEGGLQSPIRNERQTPFAPRSFEAGPGHFAHEDRWSQPTHFAEGGCLGYCSDDDAPVFHSEISRWTVSLPEEHPKPPMHFPEGGQGCFFHEESSEPPAVRSAGGLGASFQDDRRMRPSCSEGGLGSSCLGGSFQKDFRDVPSHYSKGGLPMPSAAERQSEEPWRAEREPVMQSQPVLLGAPPVHGMHASHRPERRSNQAGARRAVACRNLPVGAAPPPQSSGGPPVGSPPGTGCLRPSASAESSHFGDGITTVMIRNLPQTIRQQDLLDELDRSGFKGLYDFVYMPCSFRTGEGKGFAFANFTSSEAVASFVTAWHHSRRLGMTRMDQQLNISPAEVQGREANLASWSGPRMRRIRNPNLRPFTTVKVPSEPQRGADDDDMPSVPMPARQLLAAAIAQGRRPAQATVQASQAPLAPGLPLQRCDLRFEWAGGSSGSCMLDA